MRLQHLKQIASGLLADDAARMAAKAVIVDEVERLHWRLWNGKAKDAQISIDRIRAVMPHFQGEQGERKSIAPSRKLRYYGATATNLSRLLLGSRVMDCLYPTIARTRAPSRALPR